MQPFDAGLGAQRLRRRHDAEHVDRSGRDRGAARAEITGLRTTRPADRVAPGQGRVGPVQLVDLGGGTPGEVLLARFGEQVIPGLFDAVGEVEPGGAFGDQRPMPAARNPGRLAPGGVEGEDTAAEVCDGPGPLGLDQPQQMQEVRRRVGGPSGQPLRHVVQFRQQQASLVTLGGPGFPGQGEAPQQVGHGGGVAPQNRRQEHHRRRGVPGQTVPIAEDGGGDGAGDVGEEKGQRVAGVGLDGHRGSALPAQDASQPPVAVERLADLFAAAPPHEGQPRLHIGDADVQRWRAVQQARHDHVPDISRIGQVSAGDQPLPRPATLPGTVLDPLEPATERGEQEAGVRGAGLAAAGLAVRQDASHRPVGGGVVAPQCHGREGGIAGRADQGGGRAVLAPDPQRLQTQPGVGGVVADEVGRGVSSWGSVMSGRARSSAASVWSSQP